MAFRFPFCHHKIGISNLYTLLSINLIIISVYLYYIIYYYTFIYNFGRWKKETKYFWTPLRCGSTEDYLEWSGTIRNQISGFWILRSHTLFHHLERSGYSTNRNTTTGNNDQSRKSTTQPFWSHWEKKRRMFGEDNPGRRSGRREEERKTS